jgi:hypothetical protein
MTLKNDRTIQNAARFMRDTGLLWKINTEILHQYGIALYYGKDEDGEPEGGLGVIVDPDAEPMEYDPYKAEKAKQRYDNFVAHHGSFVRREALMVWLEEEQRDECPTEESGSVREPGTGPKSD